MAESKSIPWKPIIYVGGGLMGYFLILKPLFEKTGLIDSKEDAQIIESEKMPGWNINFWAQAVKGGKVKKETLVGNKHLVSIAYNIWLNLFSKGSFKDDNEAAVFSEVKKINTQAQISFISFLVYSTYKKNLFDGLREKLSDGEMAEVVRIVKELPLYKPKTISGLPTVW